MSQQAKIEYVPPELLKWRARAKCKGSDPDFFFPSSNEEEIEVAKTCSGCPVEESCLAYAIIYKQTDGVWGGATSKERRRMKKSQRAYIKKIVDKFLDAA